MAIKLKNLQQLSNDLNKNGFVYNDLNLKLNKFNNDLVFDYDRSAIKNSLKNLFNTLPGQRFLFPKYGCNLERYLFEPINEATAYLIGQDISMSIAEYEPRVEVKKCKVVAVPEDNLYDITLELNIILAASDLTLRGNVSMFTTEVFTFL